MQTQKRGWMHKQPLNSNSKKWQRRYFVLKDSFIFWYGKQITSDFDIKPQGCLPLGGCSVFPHGKEKDGQFVVEVTHPEYNGQLLLLKIKDKNDADDWIKVLEECRNATFENAALGDALIEKLKYTGSALEKVKLKALAEAQDKAQAKQKTEAEQEQFLKEAAEKQKEKNQLVSLEQQKASMLESQVKAMDKKLTNETNLIEKEKQTKKQMEEKLESAKDAMQQISDALKVRQETTPDLPELASLNRDFETLKDFFADRLNFQVK